MLHVTNGESAARGLHDARLPGDVLCWNDILHEGPVPAGLDDEALRKLRADFITGAVRASREDVLREFAHRDARLGESVRAGDEITLWFEHDLYDQLQLVQVLARIATLNESRAAVSLVVTNEYLGTRHGDWFAGEFAHRQPATRRAFDEATRAWRAFTAPDPAALDALRADLVELSFLPAAIERHLQEYPSARTGLSRFETQLLDAIVGRPRELVVAYHRAHHDVEDAIFMGDSVFAWHVRRLSEGPGALVSIEARAERPLHEPSTREYWEQRLSPTAIGRRVHGGEIDRVAAVGVDRWLGGVHLSGRRVAWRWDEDRQRLRSYAR
jgi:hypothetical protein